MTCTLKVQIVDQRWASFSVPIISIVRIVYFVKLAEQAGDQSTCLYSFLHRCRSIPTIWSILEPAFALVGACIPTLTIIARRSYDMVSRLFTGLRSKAAGACGSPRFQASKELPRGGRGLFSKVDSQDAGEKAAGLGNSFELLDLKASNISSQNLPERSVGPVQIYNSEADPKAGMPANQLAMNPHRINV